MTTAPALPPYTRATELLADLTLVRDSLLENRGARLSELLIEPLLMEVRTYGLHLQTLDIRQHAKVHTKAIAELSAWKPQGDAETLVLPEALSAQTQEVIDTFRTNRRSEARVRAGDDPPVCHQRGDIGRGCAACSVARAEARRSQGGSGDGWR